jgi:hypothetical protein
MGTRSTIALEFADGTVQQVYCHWDGYLSHNGRILLNNWSDPFKLRDLIDLGDMSKLGTTVGVQRPFDNPHPYGSHQFHAFQAEYRDQCLFYGRDRGEEDIEARKFANYQDYLESARVEFEEYNYILRTDGVWYVQYGDRLEFIPLIEAMEKEL